MTTLELLQKTRAAMGSIAAAGAEKKNALLLAMADSLEAHCAEILAANAEDMAAARGRITDVMLDRLKLDENRITGMANGIRDTVRLPDHTGRVLSEVVRPNGIVIDKVQVPLGLVAIIYESRPNVTSDAAALAVKSGNVCMLRSGKEAYRSARAIVAALKAGVAQAGGDPDIVNIVEDTSHASAQELMTAKGLVDLLIPRGGAGLIRACVENATVPCIETGTGICHVYVDKAADPPSATRRRSALSIGTSRRSSCPCSKKPSWTTVPPPAWSPSSCGSTPPPRGSSTALPPGSATSTPSFSTTFSPSAWWTAWTPPSRTSPRTPRTTATAS